jgi:hypothetical protein
MWKVLLRVAWASVEARNMEVFGNERIKDDDEGKITLYPGGSYRFFEGLC